MKQGFQRFLTRVLPHITIVLAGMFVIFWILDILNPTMNFINREISNKLLIIFCTASLVTSIVTIGLERKTD
ncbi:hypothetical protein [Anaeromicropila populeti]|uniref:Uncharacterized protein n=1 Tax=Anaeromicropila populeti TaxID=37658 RepID=A0A1I6JR95_9FIRM|nr:hypothetical protein [Anaeromicropila populeti]SFR81487.1 hypothetical protein SAMN05661086_01901 [Anaeromicropila populeti]